MEQEAPSFAKFIISISITFAIGAILLGGMASGVAAQFRATDTTITMTALPADGDIISISGIVYEFDSDDSVESGHILVTIAETIVETLANLEAALV
jgi:hypothetical protein